MRFGGPVCFQMPALFVLHRLCDKVPHLIRCGLLHGGGGVGVGVQGESRRVVTQETGHGFGIHAVLNGQGGVSVAEVVEADVFGDTRLLTKGLVEPPYAVRTVHLARDRGGEHDRAEGVLAVFLDQQVHCLLGQKHRPDAVGGLGRADPHLALEPPRGLGDGQRLGFHVQVAPLESHQLAPA